METKIETYNSSFCLTFELQEKKIQPRVLADFLSDFSLLYLVAFRFSKSKSRVRIGKSRRATTLKTPFEDLDFSEHGLGQGVSVFKKHLAFEKWRLYKTIALDSYSLLGLQIDEGRWESYIKDHFSEPSESNVYLQGQLAPVEVLQISYNSPLKLTFGGATWALVLGVILCGGEVNIKNGTAKMPGLVESAIKLKEAFFSKQDKKEIIALIEQLEKESAKDKKQNQDYSELGRRELLAVIEDLKRENELIKKQRGTLGPNETI
ncbi:hypothetical protein [Vibrio nigripulchritudo]|uniref:hypothetical protein n=1 Tax=Vibrio nigripulchritudo TaxID=28173 RepID=UPI0005FA6802|nr:hypothetical protein [Vibrio nigripulchritudo]KJY78939.1 hypothetical protein TW74_09540 [Vibrio nigripulchritudo]